MEEIKITENGVLTQLKGLNTSKSTGPDDLSPQLLKMLASEIAPNLTKIFKQSLDKGKNPTDWKIQHICPILKPGKDKLEPESYRPISITSVCCKIMEHIVYSQTMVVCIKCHGVRVSYGHTRPSQREFWCEQGFPVDF